MLSSLSRRAAATLVLGLTAGLPTVARPAGAQDLDAPPAVVEPVEPPAATATTTVPEPAAGPAPAAAGEPTPPPAAGDDPAEGPADPARDEAEPAVSAGPSTADVVPQGTPRATTSLRYIGAGPWAAIGFIAAATPKPCSITNQDLVALVFAPMFKESSAATSPSAVGSPMTLSRADEWTTGVYSTATNLDANYGLYEARNPNTAYQRAYWHPGIGLWQYDSAGVGAPFTAVERMDVRVVGVDVVDGMLGRYCRSTASDAFGKRRAAWAPWLSACTTAVAADNLCEREFRNMRDTSPVFANVRQVDGVGFTGGVLERTCRVEGVQTPCWYVDPGRAEGTTSWAFNPSGGPDWRTRPTPLAAPFYVVKRNGYEERHWLRADTGYGVDIHARRQLGKNARPRSGTANVGSGLTWARSTTLCDLTANRGNCGTTTPPPDGIEPPAGVTQRAVNVNGTHYRPIGLDLNGNGRTDIFWYGPGAGKDAVWISTGTGTFRSGPATNVNGTYDPIVLDANGDGRDDIIWHRDGDQVKRLWLSKGDGTFAPKNLTSASGRIPLVGDFDGNGTDEVLWYGPGAIRDTLWRWNGSTYAATSLTVSGTYEPLVGDFDGNGADDVLWYGPGARSDSMWLFDRKGRHTPKAITVSGTYTPFVGDFDGNGADDVVWYQVGTGSESIWFFGPGANHTAQGFNVNLPYRPVVVDLGRDGRDDIVWYDERNGTESLWTRWSAARARTSSDLVIPAAMQPVVGTWPRGAGGVFWYGGTAPSAVWLG